MYVFSQWLSLEEQENAREGHVGWGLLCPVVEVLDAAQHWVEEFRRICSRVLSKGASSPEARLLKSLISKAKC